MLVITVVDKLTIAVKLREAKRADFPRVQRDQPSGK